MAHTQSDAGLRQSAEHARHREVDARLQATIDLVKILGPLSTNGRRAALEAALVILGTSLENI